MPQRKSTVAYTREGIARIAAMVRELFPDVAASTREALDTVVKAFGGEICVAMNELQESLKVNVDGSFVVYVSAFTSQMRDNFTIAHELAHFLLHTDHQAEGEVAFNRYGNERAEIEANCFAAELLMPEAEFKRYALENSGDEYLLAAKFGVSVAAARVRKRALGVG